LTQSGMLSHMPSYNTAFSFANSFAHYPNPMLNQNRMANQEFTTVEANAVDMSIDALYLHELHHLEQIRRRSTRSTMNPTIFGNSSSNAAAATSTTLQNRTFFQSQPQLHSGPSGQQTEQANGDNNEKTPLLMKPS